MSELKQHIKVKNASEKSFGITFSLIFIIIAIYPLFQSQNSNFWAFICSLILLLLAFFKPSLLVLPNKVWFNFGKIIGSIMKPIIILPIYLITVLPIGIIMRLLGKDLLRLKLNKNINSYWINRDKSTNSIKNQF